MSNPFSKPEKSINPQLRNTFDLSFANNLTLDFGGLYPVFCKEVLPGDTFRINTTFGLRFMPTYFPLQSRIRADVHFFYVRNRNLWNGWQEFITNSPESSVQKPFPTMHPDCLYKKDGQNCGLDLLKTGQLGDYLGLPTTLSGKLRHISAYLHLQVFGNADLNYCGARSYVPVTFRVDTEHFNSDTFGNGFVVTSGLGNTLDSSAYIVDLKTVDYLGRPYQSFANRDWPSDISNCVFISQPLEDLIYADASKLNIQAKYGFFMRLNNQSLIYDESIQLCAHLVDRKGIIRHTGYRLSSLDVRVDATSRDYRFYFPPTENSLLADDGSADLSLVFSYHKYDSNQPSLYFGESPLIWELHDGVAAFTSYAVDNDQYPYPRDIVDTLNSGQSQNPFEKSIPVSALPFRAYESIYNAFYRDERNNPYELNGSPVYNKYIPSTDGGIDGHTYAIRYRNWEQDFLTTALPSPQQGIAPLVGLTSTEATFMDPDSGKKYVAKPVFEDDGETLQTVQFNEDVPSSVARSLVEVASYGISINDFRNVNSLQRYLENNLRNGLKYIDNLKMRWGVNPSYAVMDMPEFIGGVSEPVNVSQINQMAPAEGDPLGSYAGQLSCVGSSKRSVTHHCDEHGFIIGILSVVPVPVYSTLLPKFFTKTQPLDYFTPEFGHIGLQPIPLREVAPWLVANRSGTEYTDQDALDSLSETFGYQRPWYDYLASVDEVHGDFRTNLKDFLLHRVFDSVPRLDASFLTINPDTLTDVFNYTGSGAKILGQLYFDVKAKRPIPRSSVARLE